MGHHISRAGSDGEGKQFKENRFSVDEGHLYMCAVI